MDSGRSSPSSSSTLAGSGRLSPIANRPTQTHDSLNETAASDPQDALPENLFQSTETLVNPTPPTTLIFDRNSVLFATLHSRAGPKYRVKTNSSVTRTDLCNVVDEQILGSIKRREIMPDVVLFPHRGKKSLRMNKWLKKIKGQEGVSPSAVLEAQNGRFVWRSGLDDYRLSGVFLALRRQHETIDPHRLLSRVTGSTNIGAYATK
ncbi:hypothetical protein CVT24_002841 [Panaeolus cyanescens]|uniref:DUF6593 domain-containing protein n=1 Tax=Panaeolus cyanescens TaxID=181874 RepID=A0A409VMR4_9AGAR|nr:hypothetical protein CVT24_002841 [Panaeolus cyanescens]